MLDGTGRLTFNGIDETGTRLYVRNINEYGYFTSPYNLVVKPIDAVPMHILPTRSARSMTRTTICNMHALPSKISNTITRQIIRATYITSTITRSISRTITKFFVVQFADVLKTITRNYSTSMLISANKTRTVTKYITAAMHITPRIRTGAFVLKTAFTKLLYNDGSDVK